MKPTSAKEPPIMEGTVPLAGPHGAAEPGRTTSMTLNLTVWPNLYTPISYFAPMEAEKRTQIRWREPESSSFPTNGFHSKVNRTSSVGVMPTNHHLTHHLSLNHRSSPDGSAASVEPEPPAEPGHQSTTNASKQIDDRSFVATAGQHGLRYDDNDAKKKDSTAAAECRLGQSSPQPDRAAGDRSCTAAVGRPYLGQNGDDACGPKRAMDPSPLDQDAASDAMYCPVASDSRGELLQCEAGASVALEDVLRHYWLLSDRDDEPPKRRDSQRSTVSDDDDNTAAGFDWNPKRPELNRGQSGPSDWIVRSPEIMLPLDCDDDADSVVTLSTISEEDEDDLSSVSEADSMARTDLNDEKSFGDTSGDVEHDATDFYDIDFLSDKEDSDDQSDLSEPAGKAPPISDQASHVTRRPDGVEDAPPPPNSSSVMDSFVRSFSNYVSDIYPFSSAFVSQDSNVYVGEGTSSCHVESDPSRTLLAQEDGYNEYTVTDTLLHIKLVSALDESDFNRRKDQATNTVSDHRSELVCSPSDIRSSIASPTSWYTVSDIYNSQSFETASEMGEDDSGETSVVRTANAKCTAVARCCLAGHLSQPLDLLPSSTVSVKVTAVDPFEAIGRATAKAASEATSRAVRDLPTSNRNDATEVIEIVVTTTCVLDRINSLQLTDNNSDNEDNRAVFVLKNDEIVEARSCSVDVATQISLHNNEYDYNDGPTAEQICGIRLQATTIGKSFRNTHTISGDHFFAGGTEVEAADEWSSAVDEATQGSCSCSVAIPCTGPDGNVRPHLDEATYLPMATGAVITGSVSQDFEVTSSVAIKEPARKRKALSPKETVGYRDVERGADDVVPLAPYTTFRSADKGNTCSNLHGSDKKTKEDFQNTLIDSGFLEKPHDTRAVTESKVDSLQGRNTEKLPEKNHEKSSRVDVNPVIGRSLKSTDPDTCNDVLKSEIVGVYPDRQSMDQNRPTIDSSNKSQQICGAVHDEELESQNEDARHKAYDNTIDPGGGTYPRDANTMNDPADVFRRTCHPTSPQQPVASDRKKNVKQGRYVRIQKSQSLLLETDIDTLEHRRTPVSRKGSRGSASETKSCTDLSSARVSQYKPHNSPFSFVHGSDVPIISKEALAELLSDSASSSAGSFVKKKPNWGSGPETVVGHCFSEPALLQLSPGKESTTSGESTGSRTVETGRMMERFSSGTRWRMYRSQETMTTKKRIPSLSSSSSSPNRTDAAKLIECYDQSPSLRRRSLHIIETSLQRRASGTTAVQRTQSCKTPPSQRLVSDDTGVKRNSSSPASSSFENLVDSLLGITAVMSMGATVSHGPSSYAVIPSEQLDPMGDCNSPESLRRPSSDTIPTSVIQSDEKKTQIALGNEAHPVNKTVAPALVEVSGSPVHAIATVRKHVHFRKAKHIFRKCHFCIDANESRSGTSTPSKSPSHETTRKRTGAKKRH